MEIKDLSGPERVLMRAVVLNDPDYINGNYKDSHNKAHPPSQAEYNTFLNLFKQNPFKIIRAMNEALKRISPFSLGRKSRYIEAAIDLEIKMDIVTFKPTGNTPQRGLPAYLMHGFYDMGKSQDRKERYDKKNLKDFLTKAKKIALAEEHELKVAKKVQDLVDNQMDYSKTYVSNQRKKEKDKTIFVGSKFLDKGICVHMAEYFQLAMQEAGIYSVVEKSNNHAWNRIITEHTEAIIDVTNFSIFWGGRWFPARVSLKEGKSTSATTRELHRKLLEEAKVRGGEGAVEMYTLADPKNNYYLIKPIR